MVTKPPAVDDGVPYERLGEDARELFASLREVHDQVSWFPATPYMVVLLKELIREIYKMDGIDGCDFMQFLDLDDIDDLSDLNNMRAVDVADLLHKALMSIPEDRLIEMGLRDRVAA